MFSEKAGFQIVLLLALLPLCIHAEERPYYMWTDADGILNFSQTQPKHESVEVKEISKPRVFGQTIPRKAEPPPVIPSATDIANAQTRASNCEFGRKTLEKLQTHVNIFMRDAEGWWREVSDEKRQREVEKAQRAIDENCPKTASR